MNLFPSQIEELLLTLPALSPHFQCVLSRTDRLDRMAVRVEHREDASSQAADQASRELQHLIKSSIGVSVDVDVVPPGGIERSVGKMRRIVDERPAR